MALKLPRTNEGNINYKKIIIVYTLYCFVC